MWELFGFTVTTDFQESSFGDNTLSLGTVRMNHAWVKILPSCIRSRLDGRYNLQKILSNTGWLFGDRVLRMGVGLFVGVWVARYLGSEQFGLYNYAIAFVALFSAFATLGLDNVVIREIVQNPTNRNEILGTTFILKLAGGIVTLLLTFGVISLLRPGDALVQWIVGITAAGAVFQAIDTIDLWFQSQVESKYTVYAKNIAFVIVAVTKVILIQMQAPLIAFVWAGLVEFALGAIGLVVAYKIKGYVLRLWRSNLLRAKNLLSDSWPLILSSLLVMIYMRIDQVMLGEMVGDSEVGVYSVAVRLAEVWYFIPMAIASSTFPSIVEAKKVSESLFFERLQKLYNLMASLAYVVSIPVTFLAGWIVGLLFGVEYQGAGPMLAILIWSSLFTNLGVARSSFLMTMNWTKVHSITVLFGCVINVTLNYILIPRYGGVGAAISSCIAYWFATHGSCFVYRPLFRTGVMLTRAMICPGIKL